MPGPELPRNFLGMFPVPSTVIGLEDTLCMFRPPPPRRCWFFLLLPVGAAASLCSPSSHTEAMALPRIFSHGPKEAKIHSRAAPFLSNSRHKARRSRMDACLRAGMLHEKDTIRIPETPLRSADRLRRPSGRGWAGSGRRRLRGLHWGPLLCRHGLSPVTWWCSMRLGLVRVGWGVGWTREKM